MHLRLIREPSVRETTLGLLLVEGHFQCFTLEDQVREVTGQPVETWKVPQQTAIPAGTYAVQLTFSQRFQRILPLLLAVPGFTGVRLHSGNAIDDTEGCVLVGRTRGVARVGESRLALETLLSLLQTAPAPHTLRIEPAAV